MSWSSIQAGAWWPLLAGAVGVAVLTAVWFRKKGVPFPDIQLVSATAIGRGFPDRLPLILGIAIGILLIFTMMDISISRTLEVSKRARDYLVIVDTSRSMRQNTPLLRANHPLSYERKAGLFAGRVDDPGEIPEIARYELARESLIRFLTARRDDDRVGLIYFNSIVHLMTGFTSNLDFVRYQLAAMDSYVASGTNIRWSLEQGLNMIERYPGENNRAVILLTDADARNTGDLQQQLDRLRRLDVTFYLLWITTDTAGETSALTRIFLRSVRAIGSVYTIDDLGKGYLDEALEDIAELEDYAYTEFRHERVDLSGFAFMSAQWLILLWILLLGTIYLPVKYLASFRKG